MKLTIFGEQTDGVKRFYEKLMVDGYVGSVKAVRLDKVVIGSEPGYAIRLKGNFRDCLFILRKSWKGFPTNIKIGW
jgi:hypothetical protein